MAEKEISDLGLREISSCAACTSTNLHTTFDFGEVPLAGYFPKSVENSIPLLPMKLMFCARCSLHQISPDISDQYLFGDYRYISSVGMQSHFNELARWFVDKYKPTKDSKILEFGCNDGPLLQALTNMGFSPIGIDPATNIVNIALEKKLTVINDYFNVHSHERYEELKNLDFIFSSNSFAHISDIRSVAEAVEKCLSPGGLFIVEVQGLEQMFEAKAFDFVYHEHKYYYSVESMSNLMAQFNLRLVESMKIDTHGGSLRLVFSKKLDEKSTTASIEFTNSESRVITPQLLASGIELYRKMLNEIDQKIQKELSLGSRIAAFGASGRANMLLGELPITKNALQFVVDESPERIGRKMAQNGVPIVGMNEFLDQDIDVILILAWNFADVIVSKLPKKNYRIIIPLPSLKEFIH
jgi:SAM-dependent methyltransferase